MPIVVRASPGIIRPSFLILYTLDDPAAEHISSRPYLEDFSSHEAFHRVGEFIRSAHSQAALIRPVCGVLELCLHVLESCQNRSYLRTTPLLELLCNSSKQGAAHLWERCTKGAGAWEGCTEGTGMREWCIALALRIAHSELLSRSFLH